jgi:hypothetical protein
MLIELPVMLEDKESGVVAQTNGMFRVDKIESVIMGSETAGFDNPDTSELSTISGDTFCINMPYEQVIKFWHDALETLGGVYIARRKIEEKPNFN